MNVAKKDYSRIGFVTVLSLGVTLLVQAIFFFGVGWLDERGITNIGPLSGDMEMIISMVIQYGVSVPILYFGMKSDSKNSDEVPVSKLKIGSITKFFAIAYAGGILGNIIGLITTAIIGVIKGGVVNNVNVELTTQMNPWLLFIFAVICAPIFEEIFFRKMLIDRVGKHGEKMAMIMSGIMFGLYHSNLNQFAFAFLIGIVFAYVYLKTGKVIYTILLHGCINFMGTVIGIFSQAMDPEALELYNNALLEGNEEMILEALQPLLVPLLGTMVMGGLIVVLVISGVVLFFINKKKIAFAPRMNQVEKGRGFKTAIVNPGMIVFIVVFIVLIIMQLIA